MAEGSLYDPELAALAIKQARGDLVEAVFLLRAYRATLPRLGYSRAAGHRAHARGSGASRRPSRTCRAARCSARPTTTRSACSTSRCARAARRRSRAAGRDGAAMRRRHVPRVLDLLDAEGLIETRDPAAAIPSRRDLTREPLTLPGAARGAAAEARRAATKASCWRWATRRSAATRTAIRSPARSASARSRWSWCPRNWAFAI